ncbi:MAG TPA: beta-L-arabinofuranosidase domain-containing protein [Mobilitalea sp.]|nr:beta-L-arabinofuranosidase domain-containing protein [Mobilitalea sp.]
MGKRLTDVYRKVSAISLSVIMLLTSISGVSLVKAAAAGETSYDLTGLSAFQLDQVLLTDDYFVNADQKEIEYLLKLDVDKLLAGFRQTAGVDTKGATRYSGWENSLIGGHTLGHYMSALAQAYQGANTTDAQRKKLLANITTVIDGLKECQDKIGTGFIFGATILDKNNIELQFDNVEKNRTNISSQAWVPWYTMHKLIAGLVSIAQLSDDNSKKIAAEALQVASKLGDWTYNRVSKWSASTRNTVLGIEYGGMNDCLYELFKLTNKKEHAAAAHIFDEDTLFDKILNAKSGDNVLNNLHANTTIPKFLGALNRYITYKDDKSVSADKYLKYAEAFWTMVINDHTYITGGNSEWEHFGLDDVLNSERTNCNDETCNVYNMLKMTKQLFMLTGDVKYANYYENALLNTILSAENPETGMSTYFQPMATGYFKVYSTEFTNFWCDTGSGMENFTKLGESFYYHKNNILVVNQYTSSELSWSEKNVKIIQESQIPEKDTSEFTVKVTDGTKSDITIAFRLPDWLASDAVISVDGTRYNYTSKNGYAFVSGPFADGTKIMVTLPMEVKAYSLPDKTSVYGFKYGPVVLSALLGTEDMESSTTGVNVTIPLKKLVKNTYTSTGTDTILVPTKTVKEFIDNINNYIVRDNSAFALAFKLKNSNTNLSFVTHYSQYKQRYGIYWNISAGITNADTISALEGERLEALRLDTVQPGYGQYENDKLHSMKESGAGSTGDTSQGTSRYANANGSFSYRMIVDTVKGTNLLATFNTKDNEKTMTISIGDTVVYNQVLKSDSIAEEYNVLIPLPTDALKKNAEKVTVNGKVVSAVTLTFTGAKGKASARLCEFLYTITKYDTNSGLKSLSADKGTLYYSKSLKKFTLNVAADTKKVSLNLGIASPYGYVIINNKDIVQNSKYEMTLTGTYTGIDIRVFAEDHQSYTDYSFVVTKDQKTARKNVDKKVTYFVDCGDNNPATVTKGDSFGTHNSVTEQIYGYDSATGYKWGLIDNPEDQYGGSSISKGLYTANTWCYEFNNGKDGLDKEATNRYTKNQFESGIDRHLDYGFELENGKYTVEIGFVDPWKCSNHPTVYANYGTKNQSLIVDSLDLNKKTTAKATVTVKDGKLTLNIKSQDKAINVTYIKITPVKVTSTSDSVKIGKYVAEN